MHPFVNKIVSILLLVTTVCVITLFMQVLNAAMLLVNHSQSRARANGSTSFGMAIFFETGLPFDLLCLVVLVSQSGADRRSQFPLARV